MIPITFGKTFISKASVQNAKTGERELVNFVQYDQKEDAKQVQDASIIWGENTLSGSFAHFIANGIDHKDDPHYTYYGLEDNNGKIQALCETITYNFHPNEKNKKIDYIAVNPENMHGSKTRKYAKLGASLFREIVKMAKNEKSDTIEFMDHSEGFWDAMPCVEHTIPGSVRNPCEIRYENYDECLKKLDEMI